MIIIIVMILQERIDADDKCKISIENNAKSLIRIRVIMHFEDDLIGIGTASVDRVLLGQINEKNNNIILEMNGKFAEKIIND